MWADVLATATNASHDPHDTSIRIVCDTVVSCPHRHLSVVTPLKPAAWHRLLVGYPNPDWAHRLVHDLIHGVNVGVRGTRTQCRDSPSMTTSAAEDAAVTADLAADTALHHTTLPFGLRSASHLWKRYATAMEWIIRTQLYVPLITHYVDDTFIANRTEQLCARDLASTKASMAELGVPDAADKTERLATALTYLGIRIDSVDMSISLDASRLASLLELLD